MTTLEQFVAHCKARMERAVKKGLPGLPATAACEKDGKLICVIEAKDADKDLSLQIAWSLRTIFDADAIFVANDAYAKYSDKPIDENYQAGDLSKLADSGGVATGQINEQLTMIRWAAGEATDITCSFNPYLRIGKDVRWTPPLAIGQPDKIEGYIPDQLRLRMDGKHPRTKAVIEAGKFMGAVIEKFQERCVEVLCEDRDFKVFWAPDAIWGGEP